MRKVSMEINSIILCLLIFIKIPVLIQAQDEPVDIKKMLYGSWECERQGDKEAIPISQKYQKADNSCDNVIEFTSKGIANYRDGDSEYQWKYRLYNDTLLNVGDNWFIIDQLDSKRLVLLEVEKGGQRSGLKPIELVYVKKKH